MTGRVRRRASVLTLVMMALFGAWSTAQIFDPTPPPVLDQLLVLAFGTWFGQQTIQLKKERSNGAAQNGN